MAFVVIHT